MGFFERLSAFICKRIYLPILLWPLLAFVLVWTLPSLHEAADESLLANLGEQADHALANKMVEEGFPGETFYCSAAVLLERPGGLEARDHQFVVEFSDFLDSIRSPEGIHSVLSTRSPVLGKKLRSKDGEAEIMIVHLNTGFVAEATKGILSRLRADLKERAPEGLHTFVSGEAAIGADYGNAAHDSMGRTTLVTLILVVSILLIIYRSPVTPLVPLLTVGISFFISRAIATLLALNGLAVPEMVETFLIVILFGAGTDYCLFLASRYREELHQTHDYNKAVRRMMISVGAAISASALTTVVGLGSMGFASFGVFAATGPCLAIGIIVTLAVSLTFTPALLRLLGRRAYWPAKADRGRKSAKVWRFVADRVVAAPVWTLVIIVGLLTPFAIIGARMEPSYDVVSELPSGSPSVVGFHAFEKHFSQADLMPTTLVIRTDGDLHSPEGVEMLHQLTEDLAANPQIASVTSLTRPLSEPLPEAELAGMKMFARQAVRDPKATAGNPLGGLLHLPGTSEQLKDLKRAVQVYVSEDAHISRLFLKTNLPPYSREAMDSIELLRAQINGFNDASAMKLSDFHFTGAIPRINDVRQLTRTDLRRVRLLVVIGVIAVLVLQFRWLFTSLYLVATMILSYLATLGISLLVFTKIVGVPGLDWKVEYFMFVLLIALGIDYNILIMSRIKEERKTAGPGLAIRRASVVTGAIITSCGIIMAGTFGSLMASPLGVMMQLGFAVSFGVLLDTFVVRLMLVPAIAAITDRLALRLWTRAPEAISEGDPVAADPGEEESESVLPPESNHS